MKNKLSYLVMVITTVIVAVMSSCSDEDLSPIDIEPQYPWCFIDDKLMDTYVIPTEIHLATEIKSTQWGMLFPERDATPQFLAVWFSGDTITETSNPKYFNQFRKYMDDYSPNKYKIYGVNCRTALCYNIIGMDIQTLSDFNEEYPAGASLSNKTNFYYDYQRAEVFLKHKKDWKFSKEHRVWFPEGFERSVTTLSDVNENSPLKAIWAEVIKENNFTHFSFDNNMYSIYPDAAGTYPMKLTITFKSPIDGDVRVISRDFELTWEEKDIKK